MAAIGFSCPIQMQGFQVGKSKLLPPVNKGRTSYPGFSLKKKSATNKSGITQQCLILSSAGRDDQLQPSGFTPSDAIVQFYDCINKKNIKQIRELISNDCCFEDYSFVKAFQGKREVIHFFEELTECMGDNVKFAIKSVCQGDNTSVAVTWHLEWKGKQIPFTRGCSFYEFSKQSDRVVIGRARAMIESPIKPGALALTLFKVVTYLFDEFPGVAEKFLDKPHVILEFVERMYIIFIEPFVRPAMEFYLNFWKLVARVLGYMLNILLRISRIFLK